MVAHNIAPPTCIHDKLTRFADRDRTFFDHAAVNKEVGNGLLDIFDAYPSSRADEQSGMRYLQTINIQCEDKRPRLEFLVAGEGSRWQPTCAPALRFTAALELGSQARTLLLFA